MSLLDIDQILNEEERIPCVFRSDAKGLGFMDATLDTADLPNGTRIELPLWLVSSLSKKRMVQMELPKHFEKRMRDEISAGAANINFREYSQYFFDVGIKISKETGDKDLQRILCQAFCGDRFQSLMMRSLSSWNDDNSEFVHNLTFAEGFIFSEGLKTSMDLHQWKLKRSSQLRKASILGRGYDDKDASKKRR